MSMTSYLPTAQLNLKSDLLAFFNSGEKTKDQAAQQLADMILNRVRDLVAQGSVNVQTPNVADGVVTKDGTGAIT